MIELRPFQRELTTEVWDSLNRYGPTLLQTPPGGGKTVMAGDITHDALRQGMRVDFVCHRRELLDQTYKTFVKFDFNLLSFIAANYEHDPRCPVQLCSVQTLARRLDKVPPPDLVIWDECHHLGAKTWTNIQQAYGNAMHVGLSGTPCRLDGTGLKKNFQHLIPGPSVEWLIGQRYLSDYDYYAPSRPDLSNIHKTMGEYVRRELEEEMDKPSITGDIINHWLRFARGKKTIVYAVSVEHSKHIAAQFRSAGVMAVHLDGDTPDSDRKAANKAFCEGDVDVVCNVDLYGEGYDISAQSGTDATVECVVLARPTQSLGLYLQQAMRCMRPKTDGSKGIILDHAGNAFVHGLPDDDREWSLEGAPPREAVNLRTCDECYYTAKPWTGPCPDCGHVNKIRESAGAREIEIRDGELEKIEKDRLRQQQRREQGRARTVEDLVATGMSEGRARHIVQAREEKAALQRQLFNVWQACYVARLVPTPADMRPILKLKPKALREKIASGEARLSGNESQQTDTGESQPARAASVS